MAQAAPPATRQVGYDPIVHARERARKAEQTAAGLRRQLEQTQATLTLTVWFASGMLDVPPDALLDAVQILQDRAERYRRTLVTPECALTEEMMKRFIAKSQARKAREAA